MKRFRLSKLMSRRHDAEPVMVPGFHRFDEQTGQVYTETTVPVTVTGDERPWPFQFTSGTEWCDVELPPYDTEAERAVMIQQVVKQVRDRARSIRNTRRWGMVIDFKKGAKSLVDHALDSTLANLNHLTVEALAEMPGHLLQKIWDTTRKRNLLSFHTWRLFSTVLRRHDTSLRLLRHRDQVSLPCSSLSIYANPLTSNSFEFLTYLSITTSFAIPELVKLSAMKNLIALEVVNEDRNSEGCISDRVIHSWSDTAVSEGAFPVLRILKLWNHREVTNASLAYLDSFPSLASYDVTGCGFDVAKLKTPKAGWKPTIKPSLLHVFEAACVQRALMMRLALGKDARPIRKGFAKQLCEESPVTRLPRADVPAFLSRDEITISRKPQNQGGSSAQHEHEDPPTKKIPIETWDFPIYTELCKIGELRNDGDLKRAGVEIGDQFIVENNLICPLPIVSVRLGPTPKCSMCQLFDCAHTSFTYYFDNTDAQEEMHRQGQTLKTSRFRYQRLAFTRIKFDVEEVLSTSSNQEDQPGTETNTNPGQNKRPSSAGSRPTTSGEPTPAKRRSMINSASMHRKRKSLGDVLGSFLS